MIPVALAQSACKANTRQVTVSCRRLISLNQGASGRRCHMEGATREAGLELVRLGMF